MLEEHLPHTADSIALVILAFRLLDDPFGIDARKLDGDRRIAFLSNTNLADTRGPVAATAEDFPSLCPFNRSFDRAVIERR